MFPRNRYRGLSAHIPPIVRRRGIRCGRPLGVTILAVVKTVFGGSWNAEGRTKAIALYIGAAAKRARIKFHVTHFPGSAMLAEATASENIERLNNRRSVFRQFVHQLSLTPSASKPKTVLFAR
jgi:hypothetical protein